MGFKQVLYISLYRSLRFLLEGSVTRTQEHRWQRRAQRATFREGDRTVWKHSSGTRRRPDSSTRARKCPRDPSLKSLLALGMDSLFLLTSQKSEKKDEEDRHFFSPPTKKDKKEFPIPFSTAKFRIKEETATNVTVRVHCQGNNQHSTAVFENKRLTPCNYQLKESNKLGHFSSFSSFHEVHRNN